MQTTSQWDLGPYVMSPRTHVRPGELHPQVDPGRRGVLVWSGCPLGRRERRLQQSTPVTVLVVGPIAVRGTEVDGMPEPVDEPSGILVQPDYVEGLRDALDRSLSDETLRAELGAGGLRRVREEFNVEVSRRALDTLCSRLTR